MGQAVLDASAVVAFLIDAASPVRLRELVASGTALHTPEICDVEVVSALSGMVRNRRLSDDEARDALVDYVSLPLARHAHARLVGRVYELRHNLTAADASYVALAEWLGAELVTVDRSLARAVHRHTSVRCVP